MALPTSGALSLNQMHVEAGGASGTTASLNDADIRGLISKGSGATMSFNEWHGASSSVDTQTVTIGTIVPNMYSGWIVGVLRLYSGSFYYGSLSDGTCNFKGGAVYRQLVWSEPSSVYLTIEGIQTNAGFTSMTVNGTTYLRTNATFVQYQSNLQNTYASWSWVDNTNPFGTTTNGVTRTVVFA